MNKAYFKNVKTGTGYNMSTSIDKQQMELTGVTRVNGKLPDSENIKGPFQIVATKPNNFAVVRVNLDRATLAEASDLKKYLFTILNEGINNIIVDLNNCNFIDSTFFGVLVGTLKKAKSTNGNVFLVYDPVKQLPLFTETGLAKIFTTFSNLEEAYSELNLN